MPGPPIPSSVEDAVVGVLAYGRRVTGPNGLNVAEAV